MSSKGLDESPPAAWLPNAPAYWRVKPFFTVFRESKMKNTGLREQNLLSLSYGRIIRKDIDATDGLLPESFETYQIVEPDTIVFRFTDLQNDQRSLRTGRVRERGIITSAYGAAMPVGLEPRYADYLLRSYDRMKVFYGFGGGVRQSLKLRDIARMPVLVPPPNDQQAIADYLDRETTRIDTLIAKQEQLIATLRERRTAVIGDLALNCYSPLGTNLDSSSPIGAQFSVILGKMLDAGRASREDYVEMPYLRAANLQDEGLRLDSVNTMEFSPAEATRLDLRANDLLVVEGGAVGTSVLLEEDMPGWSFQKTINRVRAIGSSSTHWLRYVLRAYRDAGVVDIICNGSTIPHLTAEKLRALRVPNTPAERQREVTRALDAETSKIDTLIAKAEEFIALARERRAALITAAVTGQIDVGTAA